MFGVSNKDAWRKARPLAYCTLFHLEALRQYLDNKQQARQHRRLVPSYGSSHTSYFIADVYGLKPCIYCVSLRRNAAFLPDFLSLSLLSPNHFPTSRELITLLPSFSGHHHHYCDLYWSIRTAVCGLDLHIVSNVFLKLHLFSLQQSCSSLTRIWLKYPTSTQK